MPQETLETIAADVRACPKCRLCEKRTKAVPGEGSPNAEIMFIGEGPGYHEDQQGRPFVGAAGQLLNDMLRHVGLRREDVFITNVVRCRPPGNRDPQPDELSACDEYTLRQIGVLRPKVIVTLGRYSMARFLGPGGAMTRMHGTSRTWNGIACIAMYHPAFILRAQTPQMMRTYQEDFEKIVALLEQVKRQAKSAPPAAAAPASVASRPKEDPQLDQLRLF